MKRTLILTIAALLAIGAVGCHQRVVEEELTDAQKLELLDLKIEKSPKDASLLAKRAQVLLNLNRPKEALFDIGKAVEMKPDEVDYRVLQADVYLACGDRDKSYVTLGEAERMAPKNKEVQLKMGELTFYAGDFERSLTHLTKVTEQEPDTRTALLRRVCDIYPDFAPSFEELGVLYALRQDPMAVEYLSTAARLDPSNTQILYSLGKYYQDIEEYAEAEKMYRQMLDINPGSSDAWNNLGYLELTVYDDIERAIEYFDKALAANPDNVEAKTNRDIAESIK